MEDTVFVLLSSKLNYEEKKVQELQSLQSINSQRQDKNKIVHIFDGPLNPSSLFYKDFSVNIMLRDLVFHTNSKEYLVADCQNNKIWKYSSIDTSSKPIEFVLNFKNENDSLDSPEGIATDLAGNIYIADWGNHRILQFSANGVIKDKGKIGVLGINTKQGEPARFVFPTRIAIEENPVGFDHNGKTLYYEKRLLVADRNGIHLIDIRGYYLDTLVKPSADFPVSSFYGIAVRGYGRNADLYMYDRKDERIRMFSAELEDKN